MFSYARTYKRKAEGRLLFLSVNVEQWHGTCILNIQQDFFLNYCKIKLGISIITQM